MPQFPASQVPAKLEPGFVYGKGQLAPKKFMYTLLNFPSFVILIFFAVNRLGVPLKREYR